MHYVHVCLLEFPIQHKYTETMYSVKRIKSQANYIVSW